MEEKNKSLKVNAALNTIKKICSILFPLITFPYASRVLGAEGYGKINFGSSIISYITLLAGLGINNYAIREGARLKNDRSELNNFVDEVFSINVISTILAYIVLALLILFWPKLDGYSILLMVQSLSVVFTTIGTDWINSIYEDFLFITVRYIICQLLSVALMFILVRDSNDYILYALACVSSTIVANILNIRYIRRKYKIHIRFTKRINARRHLKPIFILFGSAVASLIYINSDITILGIIKNDKEVGLYSVAAKIYSMVKEVLNAMMMVAIPRISFEIARNDKTTINKHLNAILGDLLILSLPAATGLCMLSENIILLVSGQEYISASSTLRILSVSLIFATLACFFIYVIMIPYKMEMKTLIATCISAIVNIVLNFILIPTYGKDAAAVTTLISEAIMFCMGLYYSRAKFRFISSKSLFIGIANGFITFAICYLIKSYISGNFLTIVLCFIFSVFACGLVMLAVDRKKLRSLINRKN